MPVNKINVSGRRACSINAPKSLCSTFFRPLSVFIASAALSVFGFACGGEDADKPADPQNGCEGVALPEGMARCDCVDGRWENCTPEAAEPDAGEDDAGFFPVCDESLKPDWADTCDCTETGWENCIPICTDEEKAACEELLGFACRNHGQCYNASCEGVDCDPGQTCKDGSCLFNACLEVKCPDGRICDSRGDCVLANGATPSIVAGVIDGNNVVDDDGTRSVTISFSLSHAPTAEVRMIASLSGAGMGDVNFLNSLSTLTFTPSGDNAWARTQTLTIVSSGDEWVDGDKTFAVETVLTSTDPIYNGISGSKIELVNHDTETASLIPVLPDLLETTEDGGTVQIGVKLGGKPTFPVTIRPVITNAAAFSGKPAFAAASPASLIIQPANWRADGAVFTLTGIDDHEVNTTPHAYQLGFAVTSDDSDFAAMETPTVDLTNRDNDSPQILISKSNVNLGEDGTSDTVSISLSTAPTVSTTITAALNSDSTSYCALVGSTTLTFNASNYDKPQIITIKGLDDDGTADGHHYCTLHLTVSSSDTNPSSTYNGIVKSIQAFVADNDFAGIDASADRTTIDEFVRYEWEIYHPNNDYHQTANLCFSLKSRPTADVTLTLSSDNTTTGATVASTVSFSPSDYDRHVKRCPIVRAISDGVVEVGSHQVVHISYTSSSSDAQYDKLTDSIIFNVVDHNRSWAGVGKFHATRDNPIVIKEGKMMVMEFIMCEKPSTTRTWTVTNLNPDQIEIVGGQTSFTIEPDNWNEWKKAFVVQGVLDHKKDGDQQAVIQQLDETQSGGFLYFRVEDVD